MLDNNEVEEAVDEVVEYSKKNIFRFRNLFLVLGTFAVLALHLLTDPDSGIIQQLPIGANAITTILYMSKGIMAVALLYICRKAILDYPAADFEALGIEAKKSPVGSGLYAIAISLMTIAFAIVIAASFSA